jgi:hypothetical protein
VRRFALYALLLGCTAARSHSTFNGVPVRDYREILGVNRCFETAGGIRVEVSPDEECPDQLLLNLAEMTLIDRIGAAYSQPLPGTSGIRAVITSGYLACGEFSPSIGCTFKDVSVISTLQSQMPCLRTFRIEDTFTHEIGHALYHLAFHQDDPEHADCKWWWAVDQAKWPACRDWTPPEEKPLK